MTNEQKSHNIELLQIYYEEWMYRLNHIKKHIILVLFIVFICTTLPITIKYFNNLKLPDVPLFIFPVVGDVISLVFLWYGIAEAKRIRLVHKKIFLIIEQNFPIEYSRPAEHFSLKTPKTEWILITIIVFQILLSIFMLYLIFSKKLI